MAFMKAILSPTQTRNKPKLLDQVRDVIRRKHFSIRTEQTYVDWIKRYILFHGKRHPREMAEAEITAFLTHLARVGRVAASTQNQALRALLFLYTEVLQQKIGWLDQVERVKRPARVPLVLTKEEVRRLFAHLHGTNRLMAGLLYGSGLRLMECVRLRVKDVDLGYLRITVRDGKGGKVRWIEILRSRRIRKTVPAGRWRRNRPNRDRSCWRPGRGATDRSRSGLGLLRRR